MIPPGMTIDYLYYALAGVAMLCCAFQGYNSGSLT